MKDINVLARLLALAAGTFLFALPGFAVDLTCQDIEWDVDVLEQYPDVVQGCQEVISRDGKLLARFEARLVRTRANGEVKIRLRLADGSYVPRTFHAPSNFKVATGSGSTMRIFDLERGELLDIYISGDNFSPVSADG